MTCDMIIHALEVGLRFGFWLCFAVGAAVIVCGLFFTSDLKRSDEEAEMRDMQRFPVDR